MNNKSRFNLPIAFGWYAIAESTELSSGEVKALNYFDRDLALFRTDSGTVQLVDAMCPHLGAHLGHGRVEGDNVVCPFHGWKFNGDGFCTDVPYAKRMPPKIDGKPCLKHYHVQELNQMIWAWFHPEDQAPLFELGKIEELNSDGWEKPVIYQWTIAAPIQETGENAVDTAHFAYVHTADSVPEAEVIIDGYSRETRMFSKVKGLNEDGTRTDDHSGSVELNSLSFGPGQTIQRIGGIFNVVMMGTVTPIDADTTHMRFVYATPKGLSDDEKMMQVAFQKATVDQVEEDIPIWNHKFYNPEPILCDGDGPIAQYRKWFKQFYN